jgi:uncharacterized protein YifE (UPF0438 family)
MTEDILDRKLRTVFSTDVKRYSRLMSEDGEYTVKINTICREKILASFLSIKSGRCNQAIKDVALK